jgi:tRNA pseudouridine(38-40) synthase
LLLTLLIRILKIQKVNPQFSARHKAQSRTYLFRLALDKESKKNYEDYQKKLCIFNSTSKSKLTLNKPQCKSLNFLSTFESQLYTPIYEPFDYQLFLKAVDLVRGQNNFSAFTTIQGRLDMMKHKRNPVKTLKINVNLNENEKFLDLFYSNDQATFKCIELELTAESFLYKMIRRIVGTLIAVSSGKLTLEDLNRMMLCPPDYYDTSILNITTARPNGLFLKSVNYNEIDLVYDHAEYEKLSILLN